MNTQLSRNQKRDAFSLIELLVVIAIIGIIGAFAVPAMGTLMKGSDMSQAASLITDQTAAARQHALTRNRVVEVRFFSYIDPEQPGESTPYYRAIQFYEIGDGGIANPVGKFTRMPDRVIISSNATFSSILNNPPYHAVIPTANDPELPRGVKKNYTYDSFRFLPDGATSLSPTGGPSSGLWFLTVHLLSDLPKATSGTPPPNFFTWNVDPVSGAMKVFQPGFKK